MTWEIIKNMAQLVAIATGWALIVGAAWGLIAFAFSFAAWAIRKTTEEARK